MGVRSHFSDRLKSFRVCRASARSARPLMKLTTSSALELRDALRSMLTQLLILRALLLTAFLGSGAWTALSTNALATHPLGEHDRFVLILLGVIYSLTLCNWFFVRYVEQRVRMCGFFQLSLDVVFAGAVVGYTGSATALTLYLLVIIAATLSLGRSGAVLIAALAGICHGAVVAGLLPGIEQSLYRPAPQDILGVYLSLVGVALAAGYISRQNELLGAIAERRAQDLSELASQQQRLFDDISEGIIMLSLDQTVTGINQAARAIMGLSEVEVRQFLGQPLPTLTKQLGMTSSDVLIGAAPHFASGAGHEVVFQRRDGGGEVHVHSSLRTLSSGSGDISGQVVLLSDVSRVRSMEERLQLHERMTQLLASADAELADQRLEGMELCFVGESPLMKRIFVLVERVAQSEASVLITGESGTGKELIARAIHERSLRRDRPFVAINCGAIPEALMESELFGHKKGSFTGAISDTPGLFRQAEGGTVFLDEIAEMPLHMQTKLLRVLQERRVRPVGDVRDYPVNIRVLAATHRDLKKGIRDQSFREDLYYRLNVVNVLVPPLRDRREDVPVLIRHFVGKVCGPDRALPVISPEAIQLLTAYGFPGNVRELENIVERALVMGGQAILPEHFPSEVFGPNTTASFTTSEQSSSGVNIILLPIDLERELEQIERSYLIQALDRAGGVKKQAAELLGLNFRSFRYRLKKYGFADSGLGDDDR